MSLYKFTYITLLKNDAQFETKKRSEERRVGKECSS